jgi:hypothetical protein
MAVTTRDGTHGKICSTCQKWKPLGDFPPDRTHGLSQGGRHCRCRECHAAKGRIRAAEQRAIIKTAKELGIELKSKGGC